MRPADKLQPGRHGDGFAVSDSRTKLPAAAHCSKKLIFPVCTGRFHHAKMVRDAARRDVERNCYGCILFQVDCSGEFHLDENRACRLPRRPEHRAHHMPVPQSPLRAEEDLLVDQHVHGSFVSGAWLESPRADIFDRAFIQAQTKRASYLNIAGPTVGSYHQRQQHAAFELCQSSFFGVRWLGFRGNKRRRYIGPKMEYRRLRCSAEADQKREPKSDFAKVQVLL